jgi:8-oxo-dGTP pyrophosphatase MutT (NUDIX family)
VRHRLPHLLAAAVVLDATGRHVLLARDAARPRWVLVSGHVEGGEQLAEAARRQVVEQAGITRFRVQEPHLALQQDLVDCREGGEGQVRHIEHVFLVVVDPVEPVHDGPQDRDGSTGWFGVRDLPPDVAPGVALHLGAAVRAYEES